MGAGCTQKGNGTVERPIGQWLQTSIRATFVIALIAVLSALGNGLSGSGTNVTTPTSLNPTPSIHAVWLNPAASAKRAESTFENLANPPSPIPRLYGTPCGSEDLATSFVSDNGATGHNLRYYAIANLSGRGCDLPPISRIDELDADGALLSTQPIQPQTACDPAIPFCISDVTLPLDPVTRTSGFHEQIPGTAFVLLEYYRCDTQCTYKDIAREILHFGGVTAVIDAAFHIRDDAPLSVWSVSLTPRQNPP